jgi:hypothetical protein
MPNAGVFTWRLASAATALVFGAGVVWFGQGWEDTLLQAVLLGTLILTGTLLPQVRHTLRRRPEAADILSVLVPEWSPLV